MDVVSESVELGLSGSSEDFQLETRRYKPRLQLEKFNLERDFGFEKKKSYSSSKPNKRTSRNISSQNTDMQFDMGSSPSGHNFTLS